MKESPFVVSGHRLCVGSVLSGRFLGFFLASNESKMGRGGTAPSLGLGKGCGGCWRRLNPVLPS